MNIFKKWFCLHQWKTHTKEKYEWTEIEVIPNTYEWFQPLTQTVEYSKTIEILICEKCGKIHKITY